MTSPHPQEQKLDAIKAAFDKAFEIADDETSTHRFAQLGMLHIPWLLSEVQSYKTELEDVCIELNTANTEIARLRTALEEIKGTVTPWIDGGTFSNLQDMLRSVDGIAHQALHPSSNA